MILLLTIGGRTGNQLFQIAYALSRRAAKEWLISVGFGRTRSLLAGKSKERWLNIDAPIARYVIERVLFPVIRRAFILTGLVSLHYENAGEYVVHQGRIRFFSIVKGYFQSTEGMAGDMHSLLRLKPSLRRRAEVVLESVCGGRSPVFIHVRGSDFEEITVGGGSVRLPDHYYMKAVKLLPEPEEGLCYIIVGDDPRHAANLFKDLGPKYISNLSASEDLALMSLCDGGVLSNSTFAWWGAFFCRSRLGCVAPKYWWGWRIGKWIPSDLRGSFITKYLDPGEN